MPTGSTEFVLNQVTCPKSICVVAGINKATSFLKSNSPSYWPYHVKNSAPSPITFLIHFIGDCHQPLHIGYASDEGGNTINVSWFGKKTNLHSVWDSDFFYKNGQDVDQLTDSLMDWISSNPGTVGRYD
jgi:hypothetical protein